MKPDAEKTVSELFGLILGASYRHLHAKTGEESGKSEDALKSLIRRIQRAAKAEGFREGAKAQREVDKKQGVYFSYMASPASGKKMDQELQWSHFYQWLDTAPLVEFREEA